VIQKNKVLNFCWGTPLNWSNCWENNCVERTLNFN